MTVVERCDTVLYQVGRKVKECVKMAKQCDMCFQHKETLVPVLPKMPTMICKACSYKVNQVIGFLEYHNGIFTYQPELSLKTPQTPLKLLKEGPTVKDKG